jgi:hypothetical protein
MIKKQRSHHDLEDEKLQARQKNLNPRPRISLSHRIIPSPAKLYSLSSKSAVGGSQRLLAVVVGKKA